MMSYFGLQEWDFQNDNIEDLSLELKRQGMRTFEFDLTTIDWKEYFRSYIPGIKKYYFKESDDKKALTKVRYSR
jgi:alcohol-forming fatty acyl-CoA reductase